MAVRTTLAGLRQEIATGQHTADSLNQILATLTDRISDQLSTPRKYSLRPIINATGVILHTNLGRAPLSEAALEHIADIAQDYCNLELDLETGTRSHRDIHVESLLLRALDIHDPEQYGAVIVNNCAAAMLLALNSLAEKQEVIVSRGELVEIGGGFRIPEILEKSGAVLNEVGTTNRTRLADYERAITPPRRSFFACTNPTSVSKASPNVPRSKTSFRLPSVPASPYLKTRAPDYSRR